MEEKPHFCASCDTGCTALFKRLPKRDRQWVSAWLEELPTIHYQTDEKIIYENMPAFGLYLMCKGLVKVIQRSDNHKEQIIKLIGPGELFGDESMLGDGTYGFYAKALSPVDAKFIRQAQFEALLQRCPNLMQRLVKKLALEIKALQKKLLESSFYDCKEKVARLILVLGEAFGQRDGNGSTQFDLLRADLADMAGISVETAIRTLSDFEAQGWIHVHYHTITILKSEDLTSIARPLGVEPLEHVL